MAIRCAHSVCVFFVSTRLDLLNCCPCFLLLIYFPHNRFAQTWLTLIYCPFSFLLLNLCFAAHSFLVLNSYKIHESLKNLYLFAFSFFNDCDSPVMRLSLKLISYVTAASPVSKNFFYQSTSNAHYTRAAILGFY